jgi:protein-disulfide isomerase
MPPSRPPGRKEGRQPGRRRRLPTSWVIAVTAAALALSAAFIVFSLLLTGSSDDDGSTVVGPTPEATEHLCASGTVPVDGRFCGEDSAPVKLVEMSDYQCPYCGLFVMTTELEIEREFIEKGLVQLEFHNFAITGGSAPPDSNESTLAAEAAECANDQGRYWDYHYKLYDEQQGENRGAFLPEKLKQFATDLGLDRAEFDACLDSHKHIDLIWQETQEAAETGAGGTPSFLINGKLVVGYQRFDSFRVHIDEALAEP